MQNVGNGAKVSYTCLTTALIPLGIEMWISYSSNRIYIVVSSPVQKYRSCCQIGVGYSITHFFKFYIQVFRRAISSAWMYLVNTCKIIIQRLVSLTPLC